MIAELIIEYKYVIALVIFIWLISSINKAKPTKNAEHLAYLKARHGDEYDYILTKKYGSNWREQLLDSSEWEEHNEQASSGPVTEDKRAIEISKHVDAIERSGVKITPVGLEGWMLEEKEVKRYLNDFSSLQRYVKKNGIEVEPFVENELDQDEMKNKVIETGPSSTDNELISPIDRSLIEARLNELQDLVAKKLITREEAAAKRKQILDDL